MEKYKCKLCMKSFVNGSALGGHMRSHCLDIPLPSNEEYQEQESSFADDMMDRDSILLSSNSYSEEEDQVELQDGGEKEKCTSVLQDRESESEWSENLSDPGRSKRNRQEHEQVMSWVSSDTTTTTTSTTTEEDVAICLLLLSRHKQWTRNEKCKELREEAEESTEKYTKSREIIECNSRTRNKYKCETCNMVFKSYQALGGHRASHKKPKPKPKSIPTTLAKTLQKDQNFAINNISLNDDHNNVSSNSKKVHECPYCDRVFVSGQALGGHKRSHTLGVAATTTTTTTTICSSDYVGFLDLNLPAPTDVDEDFGQFELSAVSCAEFVNNPFKPVN